MSGVLGMTELLMEMGLTPDQQEMAQYIYESAQGLLKVVNDLLDFSRLEAGKLQMEKSTIDVRSLVEECATAHWDAAARKQLHLSYEIADEIPKQLLGDDLRTRQILSNLIANAIKFTDKGRIKVSAATTRSFPGGQVVRFTVSDSGIGVPANQQERLFEPFVQADGSNTRKYGGVGLGLSICRRLVKLMAGDIGVASKEGEGSDFWFEIPLEAVSKINGREENDSRS
jgi:signal transduction histidine kinase